MNVAIIIPSLNSPIIDQIIALILDQEAIEHVSDIIVVGKDDANLIAKHPLVKFLDTGKPIKASEARNLGIDESTASLLIFLDSDCFPETGWLKEHLQAHAQGHLVVGGGVHPIGDNYWQLVYNLTLFHEYLSILSAEPRDYLPTLNLSVQRSVIDIVGKMDPTINRVEDIDWTTRMRRAGIQPYLWPKATVLHQHNRTNLARTWQDCAQSGYHMRSLRLRHEDMLQAPFFLRYPKLILWLSPLIAAGVTFRMFSRHPRLFTRFVHTIPAIYLTKISWCWGASRTQWD